MMIVGFSGSAAGAAVVVTAAGSADWVLVVEFEPSDDDGAEVPEESGCDSSVCGTVAVHPTANSSAAHTARIRFQRFMSSANHRGFGPGFASHRGVTDLYVRIDLRSVPVGMHSRTTAKCELISSRANCSRSVPQLRRYRPPWAVLRRREGEDTDDRVSVVHEGHGSHATGAVIVEVDGLSKGEGFDAG